MLPNSARIKNSADFMRVTKSGKRNSTESLVGYLLVETSKPNSEQINPPKLGLIVSKSIGNSVVRHRIARQIRHAAKEHLNNFPFGSLMVIRAIKRPNNAFVEAQDLLTKYTNLRKVSA